jgi:hypothetical protein
MVHIIQHKVIDSKLIEKDSRLPGSIPLKVQTLPGLYPIKKTYFYTQLNKHGGKDEY